MNINIYMFLLNPTNLLFLLFQIKKITTGAFSQRVKAEAKIRFSNKKNKKRRQKGVYWLKKWR
jgi:hypothetical protein